MEEVELVIIGAGPTGLFATFCAGLRAIKSVTLEGLGTYGGQMHELYPEKNVYDVQGVPKLVSFELAKKMYEQATMFNQKIVFDSDVTDIIPTEGGKFILEVNGEQAYTTKSVLICAGVGYFTPNKLNVEGEASYLGRGVYYTVKSIADFKGDRAMIVGGGDSAFDYALQIEPVVKSVIITQHNGLLKAAESSILAAKNSQKIKVMLNTGIKKILGDGNGVNKVCINDNVSNTESYLDVDSVIVAIGHKADPDIFKSITFESVNKRYIKVDTNYKTNINGIYAAGDIANVSNEPKFALLAVGGAEAYVAINNIKKYLSPQSSLTGEHSSNLDL